MTLSVALCSSGCLDFQWIEVGVLRADSRPNW
jgi:hypothetical protein